MALVERLLDRIERDGPLRFDEVMDAALYDEDDGFYATAGAAGGRTGDFLTSPEVGPLFGAVVSRALDSWWRELGEPDRFTVVEAGAGRGALARAIRAAAPDCIAALRYVLVERSLARQAEQREWLAAPFISRTDLPDEPFVGVILANELLDNLGVQLLERTTAGWDEVRVGSNATDPAGVVDVLSDASSDAQELAERLAPDARPGDRIPLQAQASGWLGRALELVAAGRIVLFDYADLTSSLARRPMSEWLRTYRGHERGGAPLDALGTQDITCEVALDQLALVRPLDRDQSQAEFLAQHGIDQLVAEGRRVWEERSHLGDLAAVKARSRIIEAEALTDPSGLGSFRVLEWRVPG